ncbi:MAG: hypothetical protein U0359_26235 [Byssovorax sp.]
MLHVHLAVWLDHNEAKIFHVTSQSFEEAIVASPKAHTQLHRKLGSDDGHRAPEDDRYYEEIARALGEATEILVLGPATAKLELIKYLHHKDPKIAERVVGVETVDHPTDRQLVAYIRTYFKAVDRMKGHRVAP